MLTGFDMANALEHCAKHLESNAQPDSADRCRAGAEEIKRLLHVIRTRDRHIAELQAEIFVCDGSDETKLDATNALGWRLWRACSKAEDILGIVANVPDLGDAMNAWKANAYPEPDGLKSARLEESKD